MYQNKEETLGNRISKLRLQHRLSGNDIYKKTGISASMLSRVENNIKTTLPSDKILALANLFNVSCDYLIRGNDPKD